MNSKVEFKPADENDFDEILMLEEESFSLYDRLDRVSLVELFSEFREGFFMIIADEAVAGYSVYLIEDGAGYIESIAIRKTFRRRGMGQLALKFMVQCISERGLGIINLHVRMDNKAAMQLYESEGFVKKEIVPGFYTDGQPAYLYSGNVSILSATSSGAD